ncbi:hypothetical protein M3O39_20370, partial [Xanthomonas nasturtii]|nr:hypothetical protein [Xanthomonas nasturtii]MCL1536513.1 hypothetical protein [Xanthomonas nasturtii]MCL1545795.1 hypothetical protein [Xanthomonas nasturtii]
QFQHAENAGDALQWMWFGGFSGATNEHGISLPISQQITGHELTLPPGLKHYVDPPSVPARFSAIEQFGPPLPLPAYTPGQFDRAFKQVRHMERRREQAAKKRTTKARTTGWKNSINES